MKEEYGFLSADKQTTIHAVRYMPEDEPKAILQLVHGMVEYIDRYQPFAEYMMQNGYIVVGHDHLGHGKSVVSAEDLGYMADAAHPSDILVEDIHSLRKLTQEQYPGLPYCILGHSMGSYMLRKYLSRYGEGLRAVILSGTGDVAPLTSQMGLLVVRSLSLIRGERHRSTFVQGLTYTKPYKKFDLTGKEPENSWLTKDVEIVKTYYTDPLCTFVFTLNAYKGLMESTLYDAKQENIQKIPAGLPILLASGADDPVGDLGEGVQRVYDKFKAGGLLVQMKLYENDRHEILNETDKTKVWKDMLLFLDENL